MIVIFETEDAHGGLLIDHVITVVPGDRFVTVVFLTNGFVMVPLPETLTHIPVPLVGAFPFKVAVAVPVVAQSVWLAPALETVGGGLVTIVIFETEAAHEEKLTDHVSIVVPAVSPIIVVLLRVGVVIVPGPETFTHIPVPIAGLFPANNAEPEVAQMV